MALSTRLIGLALAGVFRRFDAMRADQVAHQRRALARLLVAARRTAFGREHRLDDVRDHERFRLRVPLRAYADFETYLARIRGGEADVLAEGRPRYWGRTSGTTGKDKLVPIYPSAIAQSRRTFETALALHVGARPDARLLGRKLVFLGACSPLEVRDGLRCGFMSSIMTGEFSPLVRSVILPGKRVDHLPAWEQKIAAIFEMTAREKIAIVAGMPPWLSAFFRYASERSGLPIGALWPDLSLVLHSGVAMDSYRATISELISPGGALPLPAFRNGFGATEGNFGFQDDPTRSDLLLIADEVFYEFVPLDAHLAGRAEQARIPLEGVRAGEDYVFVLTTPGGLSAYVIGDTVRFTSVAPYRFVISGRTAQFLNVAGEKVSVEQAMAAASAACGRTGAAIGEFTLFGRSADGGAGYLPGHEWFVEFRRPPRSGVEFLRALDEELGRLNPLYRVRRSSSFGNTKLLEPPTLRALRDGTYAAWQERHGRQGGHFKVARISSDERLKSELTKGSIDEPIVL